MLATDQTFYTSPSGECAPRAPHCELDALHRNNDSADSPVDDTVTDNSVCRYNDSGERADCQRLLDREFGWRRFPCARSTPPQHNSRHHQGNSERKKPDNHYIKQVRHRSSPPSPASLLARCRRRMRPERVRIMQRMRAEEGSTPFVRPQAMARRVVDLGAAEPMTRRTAERAGIVSQVALARELSVSRERVRQYGARGIELMATPPPTFETGACTI
jgi:hypothetical protein